MTTLSSSARRITRIVGTTTLVAVLAAGSYLGWLRLSGNFHPVIPGTLYRSAQPSAGDIARYQTSVGIKTIINLRGNNRGRSWYDTEVAAAQQLGIKHIDFGMSAQKELKQKEAAKLVAILERAEKPILIHCDAGADRSGLVSALYIAAVAKLGEDAAEKQIAFRYGHISLPWIPAFAMDRTFEALEPWLGFPDS